MAAMHNYANDCSMLIEHDDRAGHFETMTRDGRREGIPMQRRSFVTGALILLALVLAVWGGAAVPAFAAGPSAQDVPPVPVSAFPIALQLLLVVLVTEGLKSLLKNISGGAIDLQDRAAAVAYIVVGAFVLAFNLWIAPALSPSALVFLQSLAVIVSGSGLYAMTGAFRT